MEYDAKLEVSVFAALQELGEATEDELLQFLIKQKVDIDSHTLTRYLRRWKAKKIIVANYHDNQVVWKLADIPPWFASGIMAICKGTSNENMRVALDDLNEKLKNQGRIIEPRSVWSNYAEATLTFETVDPILGGWQGLKDGKLIIPCVDGKRFIPANWFKGWLRSNAALKDVPQSICAHVLMQNADLPDFEPLKFRLKVKMGITEYEAIPKGTRFTTEWSFPLRGSKLQTKEAWIDFIQSFANKPLRGLGANPFALGGRVKLVQKT